MARGRAYSTLSTTTRSSTRATKSSGSTPFSTPDALVISLL
jgi:hypothetical protein